MNYFYLLTDLTLLLLSFLLALDKTGRFAKNWKLMVPVILFSGIFFSIVALIFNKLGISFFNSEYIVGIHVLQLPIEEVLFHLSLSFLGLNTYVWLNERFPNNNLEKFSLTASNLLLGILIAMLFFTYTKLYSAITFSMLFLLLFYVEYVNRLRFMYKFYRLFAVLLLPFCLLEVLINSLPICTYTISETMKLRLGIIPFESFFHFMSILLLNVYLFEVIKNKRKA